MKFLPPYSASSICSMCGNDGSTTFNYRKIDVMFSNDDSNYHWVGWSKRCGWWCRFKNGEHIHRMCGNCKYTWLETTYQDAILESICRVATSRYHTTFIAVTKSRRAKSQTDCDWCHDKPPTHWMPTVDVKKRRVHKECFVCDDCVTNYKEA